MSGVELECRLCGEKIKLQDAYKHAAAKHSVLWPDDMRKLRGEAG